MVDARVYVVFFVPACCIPANPIVVVNNENLGIRVCLYTSCHTAIVGLYIIYCCLQQIWLVFLGIKIEFGTYDVNTCMCFYCKWRSVALQLGCAVPAAVSVVGRHAHGIRFCFVPLAAAGWGG